ncbi:hypothetical protein [Fimbriiglobus ruber]|uniref:Uncharacterized protein n=1 Tax=Fimbriiglobus ruber TaxID=1908690 RepID=A0A225DFS6_9BACT|nr:hypothetical protein [Fimbriiglobus ruber]OWK34937.1 hypothetical protein FRUB_09779 [Fimbriiglobus ruber]
MSTLLDRPPPVNAPPSSRPPDEVQRFVSPAEWERIVADGARADCIRATEERPEDLDDNQWGKLAHLYAAGERDEDMGNKIIVASLSDLLSDLADFIAVHGVGTDARIGDGIAFTADLLARELRAGDFAEMPYPKDASWGDQLRALASMADRFEAVHYPSVEDEEADAPTVVGGAS